MRTTFAIAALAGSAMAAPGYGYGYGQPGKEVKNTHVVVETLIKTVYVSEGFEAPKATVTPEQAYHAPIVTTIVYEEPVNPSSKHEAPVQPKPTSEASKPTPAPIPESYQPAPVPEAPKPEPKPEPSPTPAPAPPSNGYMGVVDEYRSKLGLTKLIMDSKLQSNAEDTAVSGHGQMVHKLNPGTYGQVLAPVNGKDFKGVFVGGWLCEMPNLRGLNGECSTLSEGWSYEGQTGHAEILTDPKYSKIGCAEAEGIWCCDLA